MRLTFKFTVRYFKLSGKLYTDGVFDLETNNCGDDQHPIAYMYDAVDWVRRARTDSSLPGLQSGRWEGFMLVDCEEGYPCLVLPEGLKL